MKNLLIAGNSTMPTSVGIWNLPALTTCTPSSWCREHCYACKGRFIWRPIRRAYQERYEASLRPDFAKLMVAEIRRRKTLDFVRIHISGDFYSALYVMKWADIAKEVREFSNVQFRTNTRRQDLLPLMKEVFPNNIIVRESIDPTRKPTGLYPVHAIKGTPGSEDYFVCKDDCRACAFTCWFNSQMNVVSSQIR